MFSFFQAIMNRVVYFCKKILQHIKEYCQEAAIHGPQHIVNQRLAFFERLVLQRFKSTYYLFDYTLNIQEKRGFGLHFLPQKNPSMKFQFINMIEFPNHEQDNLVLHIHWRNRLWLPSLHSIFRKMVLFASIHGYRLIYL